MSAFCSILLAISLAAAPDPDLKAGEQAYRAGHFDAVVPFLERALERPLTSVEQVRAYELLALTHSAFDRAEESVDAFRRLLGVSPQWRPPPGTAPKVLERFERARQLGAIAPPTAPPRALATRPRAGQSEAQASPDVQQPAWVPSAEPEPTTSAASDSDGIHRQWWFWAGVGLVAGAAGTTAWAVTRPEVPMGTLGTGALSRNR